MLCRGVRVNPPPPLPQTNPQTNQPPTHPSSCFCWVSGVTAKVILLDMGVAEIDHRLRQLRNRVPLRRGVKRVGCREPERQPDDQLGQADQVSHLVLLGEPFGRALDMGLGSGKVRHPTGLQWWRNGSQHRHSTVTAQSQHSHSIVSVQSQSQHSHSHSTVTAQAQSQSQSRHSHSTVTAQAQHGGGTYGAVVRDLRGAVVGEQHLPELEFVAAQPARVPRESGRTSGPIRFRVRE